jgi:hypothetical protein
MKPWHTWREVEDAARSRRLPGRDGGAGARRPQVEPRPASSWTSSLSGLRGRSTLPATAGTEDEEPGRIPRSAPTLGSSPVGVLAGSWVGVRVLLAAGCCQSAAAVGAVHCQHGRPRQPSCVPGFQLTAGFANPPTWMGAAADRPRRSRRAQPARHGHPRWHARRPEPADPG